jgi:hypothetical protein
MFKNLALLSLDEALRQTAMDPVSAAHRPVLETRSPRRPPAPSSAHLPSRTREYVLPPRLLPGPFSIKIC